MTEPLIRPLVGLGERQAAVELQRRVWGDFDDLVPASILMIAQETGGVASGAFIGDRLVGFVFGLSGLRDGEGVHWSDMLAVDPGYRGQGIGIGLKLHQRDLLLEEGIQTVRWTFDPLEATNAHINLRRLGAFSREYRRDLYGASPSPLHAGIGTDRLVVEWAIGSRRVAGRLAGDDRPREHGDAPILNPPVYAHGEPSPGSTVRAPDGRVVRVAIPWDIHALKSGDLETAVAWRRNVRAALEVAFREGYTAVDLERGEDAARYILVRGFER